MVLRPDLKLDSGFKTSRSHFKNAQPDLKLNM